MVGFIQASSSIMDRKNKKFYVSLMTHKNIHIEKVLKRKRERNHIITTTKINNTNVNSKGEKF